MKLGLEEKQLYVPNRLFCRLSQQDNNRILFRCNVDVANANLNYKQANTVGEVRRAS